MPKRKRISWYFKKIPRTTNKTWQFVHQVMKTHSVIYSNEAQWVYVFFCWTAGCLFFILWHRCHFPLNLHVTRCYTNTSEHLFSSDLREIHQINTSCFLRVTSQRHVLCPNNTDSMETKPHKIHERLCHATHIWLLCLNHCLMAVYAMIEEHHCISL